MIFFYHISNNVKIINYYDTWVGDQTVKLRECRLESIESEQLPIGPI